MARTENQRSEDGRRAAPQAPPARPADLPPNDSAPESLDKVRDILFGGQMRAVEARFQGLEERVMREHAMMRTDISKQLADLDASVKRESHVLGERLVAERTKRTEDLKALSSELKEMLRSLEKRQVKLEEITGRSDAEIRDNILQQTRATASEIERLAQRVMADLNREVSALRSDKADVSAVVSAFSDIATRLAGEPRPPTKNARG